MKVLHICSDFSNQSIYNQLVTNLSLEGVAQEVYVPVRSKEEIGKHQNDALNNVSYKYSFLLNKIDRINYFGKINKIETDIQEWYNVQDCDIIHAHFLFSDGGVAYKLNKKYKVPYIVAVRNTDVNTFFKYFFHLKSFALEILKNASKIVFLSPKYQEYTFEKYIPKKMHDSFLKKTVVIPNGVNPFWLNNIYRKDSFSKSNKIQFLYVGDFSKNKNIQVSIKTLSKMYNDGANIEFVLVGGGGDYDVEIRKLASKYSSWIRLKERTSSLEELKEIYRKADIFLMPSKFETFGLVYIEAMSQGLPIVFSEGQGVDGFFETGEVGFAVNSDDVDGFIEKLHLIIANYTKMSSNCNMKAIQFSWRDISGNYVGLYKKCVKNEFYFQND